MHTFLNGLEISEGGERRDMTSDDLALILCLRDEEELPEAVGQILDVLETRIGRYIDAGGTAESLDWQGMAEIEQVLFAEAMARKTNRDRSMLAYQIAKGLGSPLAHEALTEDDEAMAKFKLRARTGQRAMAWMMEQVKAANQGGTDG